MLQQLTSQQQQELFESLYFMNMQELKALCMCYNLPINGKKEGLIASIKHYLLTGEIQQAREIPRASTIKSGKPYTLQPNSYILYGAYKNDLKTREFFKQLIGKHFHFTAFGIDWINERWHQANPPTYAEFAHMWQEEYTKRQTTKAPLKKEWAYLNFIQEFKVQYPQATNSEIMQAWKRERESRAAQVMCALGKL